MEPRLHGRGWRAKVGGPRSITYQVILFYTDLRPQKRPKIACRVEQKLYGPPSEGMQKLCVPSRHDQRYKNGGGGI